MGLFKTTYTTPPGECLTPTPAQNPDALPGFYYTQILQAYNVPCECINTIQTPGVYHYDFKLYDISRYNLNTIRRAAQAAQARYNNPVTVTASQYGDFGLDVARLNKDALFLHTGIYSRAFQSATRSTCALGRDTLNNPITLDIATAPHVLIAGTTGSGKSVLLNSIICSLLYKTLPPWGVFVMIDPKQVELAQYEKLPHLAAPIAKGVPAALSALDFVCRDMDARYSYMNRKRVRDISQLPDMPRMYVVIDELADLMLTSKKAVESYIVRIAQLGRAAGIHLIVATQRPTTNVITGLIKANIPCKIALKTASVTDSITILDHGGAEKLTGRGDAILKSPAIVYETRFQAYYTPDIDIQRIVTHYKKCK